MDEKNFGHSFKSSIKDRQRLRKWCIEFSEEKNTYQIVQ